MDKDANKDPYTYRQEYERFVDDLKRFHTNRGTAFTRIAQIGGKEVDLFLLYSKVTALGGWEKVNEAQQWEDIQEFFHIPKSCTNSGQALKRIYIRYLHLYEKVHHLGEDPDEHDVDNNDSRSHKRNLSKVLAEVPMRYNYQQHNISDYQRLACGMSSDFTKVSEYDKLEKALICGLPNEVDFAINVCMLLSNEGRHVLRLDKSPRLVELLMAHIGLFRDGCSSLKPVYEDGWRPYTNRKFIQFWYDSVGDSTVRELISSNSVEKLSVIKAGAGDELDVKKFLNLGRDLGMHDAEGQRILQLASIIRNLSFEDVNQEALATNHLVFRFILLCIYSKYNCLKQMGLDTLSNIAQQMVLEPIEYHFTQLLLRTVTRCISSQDRFQVVRGMEILCKLCQNDANESILVDNLEKRVYEDIVSMLTIHDIQLIVYTLEVLYNLSELGEATTTHIAEVRAAVGVLVSLVTVEAQSYGPASLIGIKVVEHAPAPLPVSAPQNAQSRPVGGAQRPPVVPTPPPSSHQPLHLPQTPQRSNVSTSQGPPVKDSETIACQWLQAHYEYQSDSVISRGDLYADYMSGCTKYSQGNVVNTAAFSGCVNMAFPKSETHRVDSADGMGDIEYRGVRRRQVPLPFPPPDSQPWGTPPPNQLPQRLLPHNTATPSPPPAGSPGPPGRGAIPARLFGTPRASQSPARPPSQPNMPAQMPGLPRGASVLQQQLNSPPKGPPVQQLSGSHQQATDDPQLSPTQYPAIAQALMNTNQERSGSTTDVAHKPSQDQGQPSPSQSLQNRPTDSNLIKTLLANKVTLNMHRTQQQNQLNQALQQRGLAPNVKAKGKQASRPGQGRSATQPPQPRMAAPAPQHPVTVVQQQATMQGPVAFAQATQGTQVAPGQPVQGPVAASAAGGLPVDAPCTQHSLPTAKCSRPKPSKSPHGSPSRNSSPKGCPSGRPPGSPSPRPASPAKSKSPKRDRSSSPRSKTPRSQSPKSTFDLEVCAQAERAQDVVRQDHRRHEARIERIENQTVTTVNYEFAEAKLERLGDTNKVSGEVTRIERVENNYMLEHNKVSEAAAQQQPGFKANSDSQSAVPAATANLLQSQGTNTITGTELSHAPSNASTQMVTATNGGNANGPLSGAVGTVGDVQVKIQPSDTSSGCSLTTSVEQLPVVTDGGRGHPVDSTASLQLCDSNRQQLTIHTGEITCIQEASLIPQSNPCPVTVDSNGPVETSKQVINTAPISQGSSAAPIVSVTRDSVQTVSDCVRGIPPCMVEEGISNENSRTSVSSENSTSTEKSGSTALSNILSESPSEACLYSAGDPSSPLVNGTSSSMSRDSDIASSSNKLPQHTHSSQNEAALNKDSNTKPVTPIERAHFEEKQALISRVIEDSKTLHGHLSINGIVNHHIGNGDCAEMLKKSQEAVLAKRKEHNGDIERTNKELPIVDNDTVNTVNNGSSLKDIGQGDMVLAALIENGIVLPTDDIQAESELGCDASKMEVDIPSNKNLCVDQISHQDSAMLITDNSKPTLNSVIKSQLEQAPICNSVSCPALEERKGDHVGPHAAEMMGVDTVEIQNKSSNAQLGEIVMPMGAGQQIPVIPIQAATAQGRPVLPAQSQFTQVQTQVTMAPIHIQQQMVSMQAQHSVGSLHMQPSVGNLQVQAAVGNLQVQPAVGNVQVQPSVGNLQMQPPVGSLQVQPTMSNLQAQPSIGNLQVQSTVSNLQTQSSVSTLQLQQTVGNLQVRPSVGNLLAQTSVGGLQVQPSVGNLQTRPSGGSLQVQPSAGNMPVQHMAVSQMQPQMAAAQLNQPGAKVPQVQGYPQVLQVQVQPQVSTHQPHSALQVRPQITKPSGQPMVGQPQVFIQTQAPVQQSVGASNTLQGTPISTLVAHTKLPISVATPMFSTASQQAPATTTVIATSVLPQLAVSVVQVSTPASGAQPQTFVASSLPVTTERIGQPQVAPVPIAPRPAKLPVCTSVSGPASPQMIIQPPQLPIQLQLTLQQGGVSPMSSPGCQLANTTTTTSKPVLPKPVTAPAGPTPTKRPSTTSPDEKPKKKRNRSRASSTESRRSSTSSQPSQPVGDYMCEWAGCKKCFENASAVATHVYRTHFSKTIVSAACQWESCDGLKRGRWSLIQHLQDRHLSEQALKAAALRRQQLAQMGGGGPSPANTPSIPPPVYPADAAIQAIRRFSARPPYPEFMEPKEGPVTKHIRLTSALILRNLARYSGVGRSLIRRHERELAYVALSYVEASTAISNCLWELQQQH